MTVARGGRARRRGLARRLAGHGLGAAEPRQRGGRRVSRSAAPGSTDTWLRVDRPREPSGDADRLSGDRERRQGRPLRPEHRARPLERREGARPRAAGSARRRCRSAWPRSTGQEPERDPARRPSRVRRRAGPGATTSAPRSQTRRPRSATPTRPPTRTSPSAAAAAAPGRRLERRGDGGPARCRGPRPVRPALDEPGLRRARRAQQLAGRSGDRGLAAHPAQPHALVERPLQTDVTAQLEAAARLAGGELEVKHNYGAWRPDLDSPTARGPARCSAACSVRSRSSPPSTPGSSPP